jgi:hypothetical protein
MSRILHAALDDLVLLVLAIEALAAYDVAAGP